MDGQPKETLKEISAMLKEYFEWQIERTEKN